MRGDQATFRVVEGTPVVLVAPQRMSLLGKVLNRVEAGRVPSAACVKTEIETYLTFGTAGHGEGRVAYRLVDRVRDEPWDLFVWERIA